MELRRPVAERHFQHDLLAARYVRLPLHHSSIYSGDGYCELIEQDLWGFSLTPIFRRPALRCGIASMAGRLCVPRLSDMKAVDIRCEADEELVRRVSTGCHQALVPLEERYGSILTRLVARQLDRASAEEIVQDVFVSVWRHAGDFDARRGGFRAWLFQIARRRIINELRRRRSRPSLEPDPEGALLDALRDTAPDLDEQVAGAERSCTVRSALRVLSRPQREAVAMAFLQELTHEEVSNVLRVPLGTTKTRIRTGLRKLRVELTSLRVAV